MLLSAVSVLVVAQSSSVIPEGLMNNPVDEHEASRSTGESNASGDGDTRSVTDILKQQLKPSLHGDLYTGAVVRKWLCSLCCQIRIPRHLRGRLAA